MEITLSFIVRFCLIALAVFRLAELVVFDAGPFDAFYRLRIRTGMYDLDGNGAPYHNTPSWKKQLGGVLECAYCAGMWFALAAVIVLVFVPVAGLGLIVWIVVAWFAIAGLQSALETLAGRNPKSY